MLDDAVTDRWLQLVDHGAVNRCRGRQGPSFFAFPLDHIRDAVGQLLDQTAVSFIVDPHSFGGRVHLTRPSCIWKSAGLVGMAVEKLRVSFRGFEGLDQLKAGATGWRFADSVGFEAAA